MERESATITAPCGRVMRVLADEVGDHFCQCAYCEQVQQEARQKRLAAIGRKIEAAIECCFPDVEVITTSESLCITTESVGSLSNHPNAEETMPESLLDQFAHAAAALSVSRAKCEQVFRQAIAERWPDAG